MSTTEGKLNGDTPGRSPYRTMEDATLQINISRRVLAQNDLPELNQEKNSQIHINLLKERWRTKNLITSTVPAVEWIPQYNWKDWFLNDLISGFTVAVMNIPQGMAYALLANVPPVVGIYMAFFPVIIYAFLGTSRHVSMGSFAVICLMCGNVINKEVGPNASVSSVMEVATAVTFLVGFYQVILYCLRLGVVCTLLSDTLVSGFTAAAAVHVFTSQIKDILGITLPHYSGPFKLIYVYKSIFENLYTANSAAMIISAITIVILLINNEIIKPRLARKTKVPVPIELMVVLCGTLASYYGHIAEAYKLKTVGHIAKGLPSPLAPNFSIMPHIAVDAGIIAIIAYIISLSMALIFANKLKYRVNANQELLAQGMGNLFGSFFSCLPFSASLSRSVIQQTVGGTTQLASLISATILFFVLLWIGPFFEPLPRCVLSGLIVVALKGVLLQVTDIKKIWKGSKLDGLIWLSTYTTVVIVEIEYGLLAGLIVSIIILIYRGNTVNLTSLHHLPQTEIYLEAEKFAKTEAIPGIIIIRYTGCLNFVNRYFFKEKLMQLIGSKEIKGNTQSQEVLTQRRDDVLIMDMKGVTYVDPSGAAFFTSLIHELSQDNICVFLAGLSGDVLEVFKINNTLSETSVGVFPSIHDAVTFAQGRHCLMTPVYTVRL